eukprot:1155364-Pelagomonas_calceolata.AAC.1
MRLLIEKGCREGSIAIVLVGEGVGGLGVPYIGEASLASQAKMVTDDLCGARQGTSGTPLE